MVRLSSELHHFLTHAVLDSLAKKQIFTSLDLLCAPNNFLEKITSLTFQELQQLKRHLLKRLSVKPVNALDCYKSVISNSAIFNSGIQSVDDMFKGGILTGNVLEISGLPASGKTSFCIKVIQSNLHSCCGIYVVDTKNDISAKKIMNAASSSNISKEDIVNFMGKVFIHNVLNKYEFVQSLFQLRTMIEARKQMRVLIVDSIASLFLDSKDSNENNNVLTTVASIFRYLCKECHMAVIVTNLITIWQDERDYKETTMCGKFWSTVPNIKIKLEKIGENIKVCLLKDDNVYNDTEKSCFYNLNI